MLTVKHFRKNLLYSRTFLAKAPFLRIVLAFATGIFIQHYVEPPVWVLHAGIGSAVFVLSLFFLWKKSIYYPFLLLLFIGLGAFQSHLNDTERQFSKETPKEHPFKAEVTKALKKDSLRQKLLAEVVWKNNNSSYTINALVTLNTTERITPGDLIYAHGYWNKNPDLLPYYGTKNTVYVKAGNHQLVINTSFPSKAKRYLLELLEAHIQENEIRAFLSALLLGEKAELPKSLKATCINTGTAHLLAISGLHVGMISGILYYLLFPFFKIKKLYPLGVFILVATLLFYGFICNWSISILRSVTMISVFLIGNAIKRKTNAYNLLSFSALVVLSINPNDLFSIGFQLSFGAVLSIFMFYPILKMGYYPKHKIARIITDWAYISLAVQFITAPISIFYFGVFPTYFFPANMLAVPLVFLIMLVILSALAFGQWLPFLYSVASALCSFLFSFLSEISTWPFAVLEIPISIYQVFLLLITMVGLFVLLKLKKSWAIHVCAVTFLLFMAFFLIPKEEKALEFYAFANQQDQLELRFKNEQQTTEFQTHTLGSWLPQHQLLALDSVPETHPVKKVKMERLVVSSKTKNIFWVAAVFDFEQLIVTDYLPYSLQETIPTEKTYFLRKEGSFPLE